MHKQCDFDLIIVGAGCVGMAAVYYAVQKGWNICLIEHQEIGNKERYWSSSYGARQNRVQYNEEYLTRYVVESNKQWERVQKYFSQVDKQYHNFLLKEGALWFGDKNVNTSEGNIKASNAVINKINASAKTKDDRIESLYMQKLMQGTPQFMKAFKPYNPQNSAQSEWDTWSALYQPDGGSVNMRDSYERFYKFAKDHQVTIFDKTLITKYCFVQNTHIFDVVLPNRSTNSIRGKKILLSLGVYTPFFLKNIMGEPYLADNQKTQYTLEQYVASYIKIQNTEQAKKIYDSIPNYINFVGQSKNIESKQQEPTGYGFRYHSWDNPSNSCRFVKLGTMANNPLSQECLKRATFKPIQDQHDPRIIAAKRFATNRMTHLLPEDKDNVHYPCPIIFYSGRQTLLDYLNRTRQTIVVQSGGWIGKYYPLLAKTAIDMLDSPEKTHELRNKNHLIGNFINRTRFPITSRVNTILGNLKSVGKEHFDTAIIGAGCSGIYAAYRLNNQKHSNSHSKDRIGRIGVFQLSDRISGRLKSFYFQGTSTPMQLGGMRYIPTNHILVNKVISDNGIPHISFDMEGDPIQNASRLAYLRNDYYRMNQWSTTQKSKINLHTAYNIQGPIFGMDSFQIIVLSLYMIVTAPENINLLTEVFLQRTDQQILDQKNRTRDRGQDVHVETSWYRDWKNYVYQDEVNQKAFNVNFSLSIWNKLKPILLYRFRYSLGDKEVIKGQKPVSIEQTYPLYKFGFQNVIQAQFGHQAYQFVAQQNGYYSNTTNASYLDQVMVYLLDFGKVSYRTLASGFDQINYALANTLIDQRVGLDRQHQGIFLHHKLVDILPGKEHGKKYILVFHVAIDDTLKQKYIKTKINLSKKRNSLNKHPKFGVLTPIEGMQGYGEIRFTADRVIFGMPKKSITNLFNEIDYLQNSVKERYLSIYESQKNIFYSNFLYNYTNKYVQEGKKIPPLSKQQQQMLQYLQKKQEESFEGKPPLTPQQAKELERLSRVRFVKSIHSISNPQFQAKKKDRFEKDPPITPKDLMKLADSTQEMPAIKIVMSFNRNWWDPNLQINEEYQQTHKNALLVNSVSESRGVSVTDLPARQTLYFSSGADNLLLASYNDMITTQFWTTLYNNFSEVWSPHGLCNSRNQIVKSQYPKSMDIHRAKKVLVKEILKQLSLMHQKEVKEEWVKECIFQFWGNDPYGAGYHNFYSGFFIPSVMKCLRKPWEKQNFHFVGQAYSNETGWVEGAYQTTQMMLQQQLNLPQLVPGYYAGY